MEPVLSCDRVTFLVYSPAFSSSEAMSVYNFQMEKYWITEKHSLDDRCSFLADILKSSDPLFFEDGNNEGLGSTANYKYHFRFADGVDLQFQSKNKVQKLVKKTIVQGPARINEIYPLVVREFEGRDPDFAFRFEFNPNTVKPDESLIFFKLFKSFNREFKFAEMIKFTRFDYAIDYKHNVDPLAFMKAGANGNIWYNSNGVETYYIGAQKSDLQIKIYNKKAEQEAKKIAVLSDHWWRIEATLSGQKVGLAGDQVKNTKNPFSTLYPVNFNFDHDYDFRDGKKKLNLPAFTKENLPWDMVLLLRQAQQIGLNAILKTMPSATRKRWIKKLKELPKLDIVEPWVVFKNQGQQVYTDTVNQMRDWFGEVERPVELRTGGLDQGVYDESPNLEDEESSRSILDSDYDHEGGF